MTRPGRRERWLEAEPRASLRLSFGRTATTSDRPIALSFTPTCGPATSRLLGIEVDLEFLGTILAEPAVPLRLLEEARAVLASLSERAKHRLSAIAEVRRQLADQDALLPVSSNDLAAQIEDLSSIGDQVGTLSQRSGGGDWTPRQRSPDCARMRPNRRGPPDLKPFSPPFASCQRRSVGARAQRVVRLPARSGKSSCAGEQITEAGVGIRLAAIGRGAPHGGGSRAFAALWARTTLRRVPEHAGALGQVAAAIRDSLLTLMPALALVRRGQSSAQCRTHRCCSSLVCWRYGRCSHSCSISWAGCCSGCRERAKRSASAVLSPAAMDANIWRYHRRLCRPRLRCHSPRPSQISSDGPRCYCLLLIAVPGVLLPRLILTV